MSSAAFILPITTLKQAQSKERERNAAKAMPESNGVMKNEPRTLARYCAAR